MKNKFKIPSYILIAITLIYSFILINIMYFLPSSITLFLLLLCIVLLCAMSTVYFLSIKEERKLQFENKSKYFSSRLQSDNKCDACGFINKDDSKYCANCGKELNSDDALYEFEDDAKPTYKNIFKISYLASPFTIYLLILAFIIPFVAAIILMKIRNNWFFTSSFDNDIFIDLVFAIGMFICIIIYFVNPLLMSKKMNKENTASTIKVYEDKMIIKTALLDNISINMNDSHVSMQIFYKDIIKFKKDKSDYYFVFKNCFNKKLIVSLSLCKLPNGLDTFLENKIKKI